MIPRPSVDAEAIYYLDHSKNSRLIDWTENSIGLGLAMTLNTKGLFTARKLNWTDF